MMKILSVLLFLIATSLGAQTTSVTVTAKFTYDDGTPVQATIALYNDATNAVILSQALDANGKLSVTAALDPAVAYRGQAIDATTGNPLPFILKTLNVPVPIVQQIFTVLSQSELDVVLAKADDSLSSYKLVALPVSTVTVNLSSCALSGPSGARVANGVWTNVQPGTSWTCSLNLSAAKSYTLTFTASAWGTNYSLKLADGAAVTLALTDTHSWAFSTAVADKAALSLPSGASTLVITSTGCCEEIADSFTIN